jgi:hypothetical protein
LLVSIARNRHTEFVETFPALARQKLVKIKGPSAKIHRDIILEKNNKYIPVYERTEPQQLA